MHDSNAQGEVADAVPLEWALRGLIYWWQKRAYGDVMKVGGKDGEVEGGQEIEVGKKFLPARASQYGSGICKLGCGRGGCFGEETPGANRTGDEQEEPGGL